MAGLEDIVRKMSDGRSPNRLIGELEKVAGLLHCKRWHQYQAAEKAEAWKDILEQAPIETRRNQNSHHGRGSQRSTSTGGRRRELSTTEVLDSCRTKDLLAELSDRLSTRRSRRVLTAIEELLDEHYEATGADRDSPYLRRLASESDDDDSETESDDDHSESESDDDASESDSDDDGDTDEDEPVPSPRSSTSRPSRSSRTSTQDSVRTHRRRRSVSPSPPVRNLSPTAPAGNSTSANECGICLQTMNRSSDSWRCATCRNSAHVDCFDQWVANSPETNVRCIYCRATVQT
ncbi:hypothetical protein PV08_06869 [Exophiala spinifera]|uniref:RING-type domain-containing protein n=1 Tax=Exophiala spinifera TaxID=91928 RepID=A0A0D2B5C0_9EURO|nr:uncharacterized protein PV08_06869 [Exophiala spinifera]KIW14088.1 hypothetical protein PV08_06869 [Exophiala spinifera]